MHREAHGFIEIALVAGEVEALHDLRFGRQLGRHLGFRPRRTNGLMRPISSWRRAASPRFSIGVRNTPIEAPVIPEQPRHEESELRPQLPEMILDRRARETETMARLELADQLWSSSLRVP